MQDCYCGGKDIPGGYSPDQIPQFVLLTFDDAVNDLNQVRVLEEFLLALIRALTTGTDIPT